MSKNEQNNIFEAFKETEQHMTQLAGIPAGYAEMRLSTQGKVGAPEVFHIRNFKMSDLAGLSLTTEELLPSRVISILNDMIYEKVNVATWHEKEIEELMVRLFMTFFKTVLTEVAFPLNREDLNLIATWPNGEETLKAIRDGKYIPRTDINLETGVELYDLDPNFNSKVKITNKKNGFYVVFDFVHYGDQIIIQRWLDSYYSEEEKRFAGIKAQRDFNQVLREQLVENPEKAENLLAIDPVENAAYEEYLMRKLQTLAEMIRVISIINYNGEDVSYMSAGEKYERFANDPLIDFGMLAKVSKRQEKMKFGIKPEVKMISPITQQEVVRPFPFRLFTVLQAIQVSGPDGYDDGYDDED